jgi:hypothetical protein
MTHSDRKRIILGAWGLSALVVVLVSVISIMAEFPATKWMEAFYTTLRMFVFERDLATFPMSWPLIFVHFLAPLVTFSAMGMLITYYMRRSPSLRARLMRQHFIVCGLERTGKLLCSSLRKIGARTVGVANQDVEPLFDWALDQGVIFLERDPRSLSSLQVAGYKRARSIIFADDDDFMNLDNAFRASAFCDDRKAPAGILVWAHVADNRLRENMLTALGSQPPGRLRLFDAFHIAARQMLKVYFGPDQRPGIKRITICGFGSLGQDVLEELVLCQRECPALRVIDSQDFSADTRHIGARLGKDAPISFHCGDLRDFAEHTKAHDEIFLLCDDDDHGNLTAALTLARRATGSRILVRMTHWPMTGVVEHFGKDLGIVFINVDDLVSDGLADTFNIRNQ